VTLVASAARLRRGPAILVALAISVAALPVVSAAASLVSVVATGSSDAAAADAVGRVGGEVVARLPIVDGVVARVSADRVELLSRSVQVAADRTLRVRSDSYAGSPTTAFPYEVGAPALWPHAAGEGVGIALVDTGVSPVPDLLDRVAAVADLTPEGTFFDTYGHGTFMAGLLAGDGTASNGRYLGVAPRSHLVSVKVAVSDGSTTLGTVLRGLQLVDHSRERFNIRVLLLALSSGSDRSPDRDPLTRALRVLWSHGIFVVVPAGNSGPDAGTVDSPGNDPVLFTAGAVDDLGTRAPSDDVVAEWSGRGPARFGAAKPDVAAPGAHLVSLRAPGSTVDRQNPSARVDGAYFRGSGTSMAAAVTAGAAALVLSEDRGLDPDELKARLVASATPIDADANAAGAGVVNARAAAGALGGGHGTGGGHEDDDRWNDRGFWNGRIWDGRVWDGRVWDGRIWNGRVWDGRVWDGRVWDGRIWNGRVWDGRVWGGRIWSGRVWDGRIWSGRIWSGRVWAGRVWAGRVWMSGPWG
jgi:serine protease AprX